MLPLRYTKNGKDGKARAATLLDEVGLKDRMHHRPDQMSGGEKQRVAIARSLINRPSLVLGDEPTGEVDSETSQQIVALMRRMNREHGVTFILVTHDRSRHPAQGRQGSFGYARGRGANLSGQARPWRGRGVG
jgi:ABC-type lipoprotein export system ATPase subunit